MATSTTIDARPATTDLYLYAGDDLQLTLTVTDSAGAAMDLTGYTAAAQIRATADAPLAADFTTTIDTNTNTITLDMDGATTSALPLKGVWDVEITSAAGAVTTLAGGRVAVTADVTHEPVTP